ncbi:MAG: transposase [Nitrosopumilaceae archaeon]|nr:transposase [Nitrosopumilaceae archaeon]
MSGRALATIIQYKSNPQGRSSIVANLRDIHRFPTSAGAVSNAITAYARNLEGRVLPDSVAAFVNAKMEAEEDRADRRDAPPVEAAVQGAAPSPSPAHPAIPAGPPRRKTRKELKAEKSSVPYGQTMQGVTDARLTRTTTSYMGSHNLSFMEWCREWLTMAPYLGVDETKTIVAGKWCHSIVVWSQNVVMVTVRPRKNTKTINWLFGCMRHVCVVHDRIAIYNGFVGMHQECWAHLIRRFLERAMDCGIGSPEYDRYAVIKGLYGRARYLAECVAASLGVPSNAAEMAACRHRLERIWHAFETEYYSIMDGLLGLVRDLDGQEPGKYLENMLPRALTFVVRPGTPGTNNISEGAIRWNVIRPRHVFGALPNWRAARNFSMIQTFAATCRRNGVSPYHAVLARGRDPDWSVFQSGAHPPIFPHMA